MGRRDDMAVQVWAAFQQCGPGEALQDTFRRQSLLDESYVRTVLQTQTAESVETLSTRSVEPGC